MPLSQQQQQQQQQQLNHQSSNGGGSATTWPKKKAAITKAPGRGTGSLALDSSVSFADDDYYHGDENPDPLVRRSPVAYQPLQLPIVHRPTAGKTLSMSMATVFRTLFPPLQMLMPTCQHLSMPSLPSKSMSLGRKRVTGTLYGQRKGRVTFAVQNNPSSEPLLLLELAMATGQLVKEMASGTVRVLLECERQPLDTHKNNRKKKQHHQSPMAAPAPVAALWEEPVWTMFCNGRRSGYAVSHPCGEADLHVLKTIQAVSAGAGVLPPAAPPAGAFPPPPMPPSTPFLEKGKKGAAPSCCHGGGGGCGGGGGGIEAGCSLEVMYMRARFERVVGSKDSEAFYMMSPDGGKAGAGSGGSSPELSIFLLRL